MSVMLDIGASLASGIFSKNFCYSSSSTAAGIVGSL